MIIITPKQMEQLKPYIKELDALVKGDDVQLLLDAIDDVIVDNIVAHDDEPDEEGIRLQLIYDEIFEQN